MIKIDGCQLFKLRSGLTNEMLRRFLFLNVVALLMHRPILRFLYRF